MLKTYTGYPQPGHLLEVWFFCKKRTYLLCFLQQVYHVLFTELYSEDSLGRQRLIHACHQVVRYWVPLLRESSREFTNTTSTAFSCSIQEVWILIAPLLKVSVPWLLLLSLYTECRKLRLSTFRVERNSSHLSHFTAIMRWGELLPFVEPVRYTHARQFQLLTSAQFGPPRGV